MAEQAQGSGTYCDGTTGIRHPVTVTLDDAAMTLAGADGHTLARWDYAALTRIAATGHRLRLGLIEKGSSARLEVADPTFAEAVKERLGFRTLQVDSRERRTRHRILELSIGAVLAVVLIGVVGVPAIAELMLPFIPRSAEEPIGAQGHAQALKSYKGKGPFECGEAGPQERAGKAAFLRLFAKIETAANLPVTLHPYVLRTDTVNAVAMPGGYVHVYGGIVEQTQSPEELAGIIGHELGHVAHRDAMRSLLHATGVSYLFGLALGDVVGSGGMIAAAQTVLGPRNTRAQEAAADQFGVDMMRKLGADSHGLAAIFERWARNATTSRRMLILYDHPTNADRVAAIRATPAVANPAPLLSAQDWQTLKQVCSGR